jgi:hypothetical protein
MLRIFQIAFQIIRVLGVFRSTLGFEITFISLHAGRLGQRPLLTLATLLFCLGKHSVTAVEKSVDLGDGVVDESFACGDGLLALRDGVLAGGKGLVDKSSIGAGLLEIRGRGTGFTC